MKSKGVYMKGDGNGGLYINKTTFGIIIALITILSVFASIVAASVTNQNDIDVLKKSVDKLEFNQDKMIKNQQDIAVINTKMDIMNEDIKEIKRLLKNG